MRVEVRLLSEAATFDGEAKHNPHGCTLAAACLRCGAERTGEGFGTTAEAARAVAEADLKATLQAGCPRVTEFLGVKELNAYEVAAVPEGVTLWCERLGQFYPLHLVPRAKAVAGLFGALAAGERVYVVAPASAGGSPRPAALLADEIASWGWPCSVRDKTPDGPELTFVKAKPRPTKEELERAKATRKAKAEAAGKPRVFRRGEDRYAFDLLNNPR